MIAPKGPVPPKNLDMDCAIPSVQNTLVHHFRQGGVWEDGLHQIFRRTSDDLPEVVIAKVAQVVDLITQVADTGVESVSVETLKIMVLSPDRLDQI